MNYNLTDFTLKELRMLHVAVSNLIQNKTDRLFQTEIFPDGPTKTHLVSNANNGLSELREMNVRILTSIDIVKNRESIQSN